MSKLRTRVGTEAYFLSVAIRAGMLGIEPPHKLYAMAAGLYRYGLLGGGLAVAAVAHPDQPAVIDELGTLTYREFDEHTNAIANAWIDRGLQAGDGVAVMARNHRGFLEAVMAASKCGARIILMNTGFSAPQVLEVSLREGVDLFVHDDEFEDAVAGVELRHGRWRSFTEPAAGAEGALSELVATTRSTPPRRPRRQPRIVILTSGTTGTPKGAGRKVPLSLSPIGGALSKVPFRGGQVTAIAAPMFHALGFTQAVLAIALHSTMVLHRRFEPETLLDCIERERVEGLVLVPVMLQRLLALSDEQLAARDLSSLRIVYLSGSQLGSALAERAAAQLGPVLYNLYGSTEIAYATIATPDDLEAAPSCVGRVVRGAVVKIIGPDGAELRNGEAGRIFVGNLLEFEGYTGGGDKERIDGLVASGDVGHFDEAGRLFIDGRDDEMIISGGENVFPREVEDLLACHPAIIEVAAIGVHDELFGQRLSVFVVCEPEVALSEEDVREYVRQNLARYKVPRDVEFITALPRNPTGKVVKRELRGAS